MRPIAAFLLALSSPVAALALEPREVFLLINKSVPASKELAEHYCKARGVPAENVIVLDVPTGEDISRKDYDAKIVAPIREALDTKKNQAKVLLTFYGVPLRVGGAEPNDEERKELKTLEPDVQKLEKEIKQLNAEIKLWTDKKDEPKEKTGEVLKDLRKSLEPLQSKLTALQKRRSFLNHAESHACVDSELMLLWHDDYELRRWQRNLLYWKIPEATRAKKPPLLMTSRLDGPTPELVKRLIDDAVAVEKKGLTGKVYVDARGIGYDPKGDAGYGYGGYDQSMREMGELLEKEGKLTVVLDNKDALFPAGACTDCALYCGWYSHANFIDCCKFVPGAIAWHLASSEAVSLRNKDAKFWCVNQLQKGACATLGPVGEPYTIGFPKPAEFFGFLATGKYTLVECYSRTVMLTSWMGCLVGDPLYNPYKANPALAEDKVHFSPKGGKFLFGGK